MTSNQMLRKKILYILTLLSMLATIISIAIFTFVNQALATVMSYQLSAYFIVLLLIYFNKFTYRIQSYMIILLVFVQMLTLPIFEGIHSGVITWLVLFPIVSFGFKRTREAIIINSMFIISFLTLFFSAMFHESYTLLHIGMICIIFVIVSILLFFIASIIVTQGQALQCRIWSISAFEEPPSGNFQFSFKR